MTSSQDDEDWDRSTSDIQSEDSDELFDKRPNRWRGPPQSWRTLTEEDRLTYNAFERLRNEDLSIHLYNAFALRHAPRLLELQGSHVDAETGQPVPSTTGSHGSSSWAPPKAWTAWPLRPRLLPPDDFMRQTDDADEAFTFRRVEREYPSKRLEEVVSATILGFAKEKFRERALDKAPAPNAAAASLKREPLSSENEGQDTGSDDESNIQPSQRLLQPAVATNDDVSYELIRPSTRAILRKLDQTLTVLHNTRMASAQSLLDETTASASLSSSSSDEEEDIYDEATPSRPSSRSRSRSRSLSRTTSRGASTHSHNLSAVSADNEVGGGSRPTEPKRKSNRGRKPALVPREGESERDFLIRRAKMQKKKVPIFSDEEQQKTGEGVVETAAETTEASSQKSRSRSRSSRGRQRRRPSSVSLHAEYWRQKRLERLGLRDWSDVMGAAALAGFSPQVIARATQRCANLFGQGMEMHTIGDDGIETKRYQPGEPVPESFSDSDEEEDGVVIRHARSMSRHSSMAPSRAASPEAGNGDELQEGQSPRKRQKRSNSRGGGQHYCPHGDCERAIKGFDRPYNLKRHIDLVHQGQQPVASHDKTEEARGDDICGGVCRDGFLEPIRMQKGWRAEDTAVRARKSPQKKQVHDKVVIDG